jgi:hypothetical protein
MTCAILVIQLARNGEGKSIQRDLLGANITQWHSEAMLSDELFI